MWGYFWIGSWSVPIQTQQNPSNWIWHFNLFPYERETSSRPFLCHNSRRWIYRITKSNKLRCKAAVDWLFFPFKTWNLFFGWIITPETTKHNFKFFIILIFGWMLKVPTCLWNLSYKLFNLMMLHNNSAVW